MGKIKARTVEWILLMQVYYSQATLFYVQSLGNVSLFLLQSGNPDYYCLFCVYLDGKHICCIELTFWSKNKLSCPIYLLIQPLPTKSPQMYKIIRPSLLLIKKYIYTTSGIIVVTPLNEHIPRTLRAEGQQKQLNESGNTSETQHDGPTYREDNVWLTLLYT